MPEQAAAIAQAQDPELYRLLCEYYRHADVRKRMCEFLGAADLDRATALYITATDGYADYRLRSLPCELYEYLDGALEIDRSLWDKKSLIADIDLEYHNFDFPAAPWLDPERAFRFEQPVLNATLRILGKTGIHPLVLVSGRGFHLLWAVRRASPAFRRIEALGHVPVRLEERYAGPCAPDGTIVEPELGRAFAGLGLIMEYIGHCVWTAAETAQLPVKPAAIEVGPGPYGREIVSFDLSEYGDPFHTRHIRIPFSAYLKPRQMEWALGRAEISRLLPIFEIPLGKASPLDAIRLMREPDAVRALSKEASVEIPDASEPMGALLDEYEHSELAEFHQSFYARTARESSSALREPPCLAYIFNHPNDWLLRPAALQHVVRVLMTLGWRPTSIAARIYGSYLNDHDWRDTWVRLEPCNRALFYTRLFSGMIVAGVDKLVDFNCVSHREKGYCTVAECSSNLLAYREALLKRRN